MNSVILSGYLTKDPEVKYIDRIKGFAFLTIVKYTLEVKNIDDSDSDDQKSDFIDCLAFGKLGLYAEKRFYKGAKIMVSGNIQIGSYTNQDGIRVYTTNVVIESNEYVGKNPFYRWDNSGPYERKRFKRIPDEVYEKIAEKDPFFFSPSAMDGYMNVFEGLEGQHLRNGDNKAGSF